eukprot:CAMPEP_0115397868 /NCGR_PEP_ID=MMETSP0271-20121206/14026_1 /TAXON_ID=71861 /ORGANISM="Scrippsiella trochoidea, Strain CCMP3099" /LENGTH=156 /DNA_ID=CAMNT_0002821629 /DNA_START=253 /DNA_END=724 /DNA_ORIENTATION=+
MKPACLILDLTFVAKSSHPGHSISLTMSTYAKSFELPTNQSLSFDKSWGGMPTMVSSSSMAIMLLDPGSAAHHGLTAGIGIVGHWVVVARLAICEACTEHEGTHVCKEEEQHHNIVLVLHPTQQSLVMQCVARARQGGACTTTNVQEKLEPTGFML